MLKITKNQCSIQVTASESGFYPFDGTVTFPTNSLFTATSANTDMITFKSASNGDVQFVGNYKDITISGRSYDTKQKFLTAFSNLANQGSVDAYTKAETDTKLDAKQNTLTAGTGITIDENNVISSTGGSGGGANPLVNVKGTDSATITDTVTDAVAIGSGAEVEAEEGIAIGKRCYALGRSTVAIGSGANTVKFTSNSIAIGSGAKAYTSGVAIGSGAKAYISGVAIGKDATTSTDKPMVINAGSRTMIQSDATGKLSILKGDGSDERIVIQDALSAGGGGTVDAYTKTETDNLLNAKQNTLTAGTGITIDENNVISSTGGSGGSANPYVNVKGTGSATIPDTVTDAVAIGSSASVTNDSCIAIGKDTMAQAPTGYSSIVIGSGAKVTKDKADGIVIGSGAKVNDGRDSIVIGNNARSETSFDSVVIGHATFSKQSYGIAIGTGAGAEVMDNSSNSDSIAIGHFARADGENSIALGYYSKGQKSSVAIGRYSTATAEKGIAIGKNAMASVENGVAIGELAQTAADKPLVINAGYKTVDDVKQPLTVLQSDANGKISIIKGDDSDERIVISDKILALENEIETLKAEIAALKGGASTGA